MNEGVVSTFKAPLYPGTHLLLNESGPPPLDGAARVLLVDLTETGELREAAAGKRTARGTTADNGTVTRVMSVNSDGGTKRTAGRSERRDEANDGTKRTTGRSERRDEANDGTKRTTGRSGRRHEADGGDAVGGTMRAAVRCERRGATERRGRRHEAGGAATREAQQRGRRHDVGGGTTRRRNDPDGTTMRTAVRPRRRQTPR